MNEKPQKRKSSLLHKPFDLNRNGKIDPAEAALMMMVFDDIDHQSEEEVTEVSTSETKQGPINLDDLDIEGI